LAARPHGRRLRGQPAARALQRHRVRLRRGPLDAGRGQRRGGAGTRAGRLPPRALRLPPRRRLPEPGALRHAPRLGRPPGEEVKVDRPRSAAFVFFGATGDLAYKKIFPALQALARRGKLDMPVVGVAKSGWGLEQLVERAKASVTEYGGLDAEAFP